MPMSEEQPRYQDREGEHRDDVRIGPLEKNGDKLLRALEAGSMVAVLSKNEVMYTYLDQGYQCWIHPLDAPEGRRKTLPRDEKHRAVIKNLAELSDQLFEIEFAPGMHPMGVMVAAERGIIRFLDMIGRLPAEDHDFMAPGGEG